MLLTTYVSGSRETFTSYLGVEEMFAPDRGHDEGVTMENTKENLVPPPIQRPKTSSVPARAATQLVEDVPHSDDSDDTYVVTRIGAATSLAEDFAPRCESWDRIGEDKICRQRPITRGPNKIGNFKWMGAMDFATKQQAQRAILREHVREQVGLEQPSYCLRYCLPTLKLGRSLAEAS